MYYTGDKGKLKHFLWSQAITGLELEERPQS